MATARTFDLARPFVAIVPLIHEDRRYAAGDPFAWRDLGLSSRKLLAMWGAYMVGNAPAEIAESTPDALGGFKVLARIGAAFAGSPPFAPKPAKRPRAGA